MSGEQGWTLGELGERVERALGVSDYQPAASGRVRAVPDGRTIRYYATLGLVDRPELAGRTALYGPRHLLQLVAIKRLQGEGRSLEAIQHQLAGLDARALAQVARVPDEVLQATTPAAPAPEGDASAGPPLPASPPEPSRRASFWRTPPVEPAQDESAVDAALEPGAGEVQGLSLDDEVFLVWSRERDLSPGDILAIRSAAAPLLDLLRANGLVRPRQQRPGPE